MRASRPFRDGVVPTQVLQNDQCGPADDREARGLPEAAIRFVLLPRVLSRTAQVRAPGLVDAVLKLTLNLNHVAAMAYRTSHIPTRRARRHHAIAATLFVSAQERTL